MVVSEAAIKLNFGDERGLQERESVCDDLSVGDGYGFSDKLQTSGGK
jgi:hypothetical protein